MPVLERDSTELYTGSEDEDGRFRLWQRRWRNCEDFPGSSSCRPHSQCGVFWITQIFLNRFSHA